MIQDLMRRTLLGGLIVAGGTAAVAEQTRPARGAAPMLAKGKPLVIGHRGACALRPEHTLASYAKAIADGADYVEPDLVSTKDGVLVARHECNIAETTDVGQKPEFAGRKTTRTIDGETETGWFTTDFTLTELKTLRARERLPLIRAHNTVYDGIFDIPTFEEIIDFVAAEVATRGRPIGLIPELKSTPYLRSAGLPTEAVFVRIIAAHRTTTDGPLEIQCFYADSLRMVRDRIGTGHANIRLMQLLDTDGPATAMMTREGLAEIASYADVIGPNTRSIIPLDATGHLAGPTRLVDHAHAEGLLVHPYTFRPENRFLAADFRDGAGENARNPEGSIAEIRRYLETGIDGFFTDDPGIGRSAVG